MIRHYIPTSDHAQPRRWLQRLALLLMCMAMTTIYASAQLKTDDDGNYIIANKADLMTLANNKYYWSEARSFVQIFDIDLGGAAITPIGNTTNPFTGTYDGGGHTISNGVMYWDYAKGFNVGLFGYVYGLPDEDKYACIKNLNIVNFAITRSDAAVEDLSSTDSKLGILVAQLGEYSQIHDISLSGCSIDDGGQHTLVRGFMVGGVVGDLYKSVAENTTAINAPGFVFRNIFANVDIDVSNTFKTRNDHQFMVGGIVGRIRTPSTPAYMPDHTIYTGHIVAPRGSASPTVANIRSAYDDSRTNTIRAYACEFPSKKQLSQFTDYDDIVKTRLYYDYEAYNSEKGIVEAVDDTYPAGGFYVFGTRTFTSNAKNAKGDVIPDATVKNLFSDEREDNWSMVQGVNFGTFSPLDTKKADMLQMLTDGHVDSAKSHWEWTDDGHGAFRLVSEHDMEYVRAYIETDNTVSPPVYRAKLAYKAASGNGIEYPGIDDGQIQWQYTNSVKTPVQWEDVSGDKGRAKEITYNSTLFYRFVWTKGDVRLESDYMAPTRVVYVFNRASNDEYNSIVDDSMPHFYADDPKYALAGSDDNDGSDPEHAVLTMSRAYDLLDEYGDMHSNKVVVMGYYRDEDFLSAQFSDNKYAKPATVTGTDNTEEIKDGIMGFARKQKSIHASSASDLHIFLQAPLRLDNISILREWTSPTNAAPSTGQSMICCNYFDFTVDENVRFINFVSMRKTFGLPASITSLPFLTLVGGNEDCNADAVESPIQYPSDVYPDRPGFYTTPGVTTINLRSGVFGRVICCGRNDGANLISGNVTGSPDVPSRIRLNVNITGDIDLGKDPATHNESSRYGFMLIYDKNSNKIKRNTTVATTYSHNIGLISGGQTDGSVYGDVVMNIYGGHIGRIITGNITYGRVIDALHPADSFWGRSILNIYGNTEVDAEGDVTSPTVINEVFGGLLGRLGSSSSWCYPYFYGQSVINMYGGYIGGYTGGRTDNGLGDLKGIEPSLYGVGSGGVTGLGTLTHHTTDPLIPYYDSTGRLCYGDYYAATAPDCHMPVMNMADGKTVDLAKAVCEVNLYSGYIKGSVYGAGYGYSSEIPTGDSTLEFIRAPEDIGVLYGDSRVTLHRHPDYLPPVVLGNVYGAGAGACDYAVAYPNEYPNEYAANPYRFQKVASQYGNSRVVISDGIIGDAAKNRGGDVYAGSQGIPDYPDIAALYGNTSVVINGGTIYGNIYGGSEIANVRRHPDIPDSGNTSVVINGGTIGNNIFGGSKGIDAKAPDNAGDTKAIIEGSTSVTVNGGDFIDWPYIDLRAYKSADPSASKPTGINIVDNRDQYRTFNIYGGGYMNCDVQGDANLNVYSSLLSNEASFVDPSENPNALSEHTVSNFQSAYMDITYRCFCVYGGGFGEKTNVRNANVYVTIPRDRQHVSLPHGKTLDRFLDHQSFFDIAGGGYSGDVGYWATPAIKTHGIDPNTPVKTIGDLRKRLITSLYGEGKVEADLSADQVQRLNNELVKMYDHYEGGDCKVTIDDYTFARKVMGGGFYGSCLNTNTHVRCGSLRQVYGGSLLGYVHNKAYLQFGNRIEDFVRWDEAGNRYVYSEHDEYAPFKGDYEEAQTSYADVWSLAEAYAKELNDHIYVTENIYGGNDVKGIIGTKFWEGPGSTAANPIYGIDETDGGPLYCTDTSPLETKGIVFNIYGGNFMGDVYGAGNGHYRGYFVPEWVRYNDGPARMYRTMISSVKESDGSLKYAKAYRSRPMVGSVNINLRGNSANDMINLHGNFFGGGRECTIGQFNTILPLEDPRRLVQGGSLRVNFGGYVQVDGNVYLGVEGRLYSSQQLIPETFYTGDAQGGARTLQQFDGSTTKQLARLGDAAYDHWYYDSDLGCYMPGYPAPGKVDGNFGLKGEHMLASYMQNVQLQGDVELTFYHYLYERDADNNYVYWPSGERKRKTWLPGEIAIDEYDAPAVTFNSFYLGGLCGSMTNNTVMKYTYPASTDTQGHEIPAKEELWGTVYRITLPRQLTIRDKVVMGSENAITKIYPYNDDCTALITTKTVSDASGTHREPVDPTYEYKGGLITQHTYSYDLVVYNQVAKENAQSPEDVKIEHYLPDDFYTDATNSLYNKVKQSSSYEVEDEQGQKVRVRRSSYAPTSAGAAADVFHNDIIRTRNSFMVQPRYDLAWVDDGSAAYVGPREDRRASGERTTVTKLTAICQFDPLAAEGADASDHHNHYGGNIYGGCYNSGLVMGDVVMNVGSNMLGSHLDEALNEQIENFSSLKYNIGRIFGGGYGKETTIEGDTYINLLRNFKGMNVFGGGMEGDVTGTAHVTYIGTEQDSYVFGSIYGGALRGDVGTLDQTQRATVVHLFSGNVNRVYGGSCMGDLYGRAFVELCDKVTDVSDHLDHLDLTRVNVKSWGGSRLIAGKVFGGNDVAGNIVPSSITTFNTDPVDRMFEGYTTGVYVHEVQEVDEDPSGTTPPAPSGAPAEDGPGKTSPGSDNGYNGFPLISDLFGGSNGNYGVQGPTHYVKGEVEIATGEGIATMIINLAEPGQEMAVPHIKGSHIVINGGTVINAYGGGDMCNITEDCKITVDYPAETSDGQGGVDAGATKARAGFDSEEELERVWRVLKFSSDQQKDEVSETDKNGRPIFTYQIYRLFGGNNNADMAIQPDWEDLKSGYIGSLYSGGNFGKMTYYRAADPSAVPAVKEAGLTLTVDSYDLTINNVYGGGRVGDIDPDTDGATPSADFYGATLNIRQGIIDHVYGGNDVSGYVSYGTNVNLYGAISGDVYCAGNGNYLYKYDREASAKVDGVKAYDYKFVDGELDRSQLRIREDYAFSTDHYRGARYFLLPAKTEYGLEAASTIGESANAAYRASDAETLMAINSYRPHVQRAKIYISGNVVTDDNGDPVLDKDDQPVVNRVWVRGNVYCGGNSASVVEPQGGAADYDVEFEIGSHVILNGVFLGSNGAGLAEGEMIANTEKLNADSSGNILLMTGDNDLDESRLTDSRDLTALNLKLYPKVLDIYMRAVETSQAPSNFNFDTDITDAYVGEFCVGGNRGSMMTDKRIGLDFPESITIFGRVIGGCKDANVTYNGVTHIGGLTVPLAQPADPAAEAETVKVEMRMHSRFQPLALLYPDPDSNPKISMYNYMVDADGVEIAPADQAEYSGKKYYVDKQCNIYGGCFTSGRTVGDIHLDLYSDMLNYDSADADPGHQIDKQAVINGMTDPRSWRSFTVVGGGYGADTEVYGNISVRMLPTVTVGGTAADPIRQVQHPSLASLFGGSQEGLVVGNTNVEVRDGKLLANLYGASEAAKMYGSTSVIVGYPRYYRVKKSGNYRINRVDYMSDVANNDLRDEFDEVVVPKTVAYRAGEVVSKGVYDMVMGRVQDARVKWAIFDDPQADENFRVGKAVADEYVDIFGWHCQGIDCKHVYTGESLPDDYVCPKCGATAADFVNHPISDYFEEVASIKLNDDKTHKCDHITPDDFDATWDDIVIWVGDQQSNEDPTKPYYGQGNIYGGGYIPNTTDRTLVGQPTVMRFTPEYNLGIEEIDPELTTSMAAADRAALNARYTSLYGGNTSVMIWDNEDNATLADGDSSLKDHVHIATGYFLKKEVTPRTSAKGLYRKVKGKDAYVYQTSGRVDPDDLDSYYEKMADGGVYGGGRKVFAQAFRGIDIAYYGYAEHSPERPKLLNTIQRADVATVTDCCMDLVGASDFTVHNFKEIYYAINRVGELRMYSSLSPDYPLKGATVAPITEENSDGTLMHLDKRSRNYIALYNSTNHLGAFRSNWTFEDIFHQDAGALAGEEADDYKTGAYPAKGGLVSYVNRKHRYIDLYECFREIKQKEPLSITADDIKTLNGLYVICKGSNLTGVTGSGASVSVPTPNPGTSYLTSTMQDDVEEVFKQRNVGTSANMIGISSGYKLSIEGLACQRGESKETRYYGPVYGITEVKLLTTVSGMGGGYVYALNHHRQSQVDGSQAGVQTENWCSKFGDQDFLQTTGNFVFPGAAYHTVVDDQEVEKHNFIIDDCFDHYDPINHGYYGCVDMGGHPRVITKAPKLTAEGGTGSSSEPAPVDVNDTHEIHYWYVSGNTYVYNVTITGITSDTDPEHPRSFYIDNDNGMINIFNVKSPTGTDPKYTDILVTEVMWFEHEDENESTGTGTEPGAVDKIKDDTCDITRKTEIEGATPEDTEYTLDTQYQLYLTIDGDTRNDLTPTNTKPGAYVIQIPRHSYHLADDYKTKGIINQDDDYIDYAWHQEGYETRPIDGSKTGMVVDPNAQYVGDNTVATNKFYTPAGAETNYPRLGVRLVDGQRNRLADEDRQNGIDYYDEHLKGDHNVQVTLKTTNPGSKEAITYIINIDIRYLMGPALYGQIEIENCALPGEYIYANSNNVEVLMDENLSESERHWRLYPNDDEGHRISCKQALANGADEPMEKVLDTDPEQVLFTDADGDVYYHLDDDYLLPNTDKEIHIPAYMYENGWEVVYCVRANDQDFQASLPYAIETPDPADDTKTIHTVVPQNRLQVHNYHRMRPIYNNQLLDLRLMAGARTYIEDQEDMTQFFKYLQAMQGTAVDAPFVRFTTPDGHTVNPRYAHGINFFMQGRFSVPNTSVIHNTEANPLYFTGTYHGNGQRMLIPADASIYMVNGYGIESDPSTWVPGYMFNTGFVSDVDAYDTTIYDENYGEITNCFYFNSHGKGRLTDMGTVRNCYQNTPVPKRPDGSEFAFNEYMQLSTQGFRYGHAAYNLNGYYLQKRHILLHKPAPASATEVAAEWHPGASNNPWALGARDRELRKMKPTDLSPGAVDLYDDFSVDYVERMFNNGDYRYAFFHLPDGYDQFTEALRTAEVPNYMDGLNHRGVNGKQVSQHDYTHKVDERRWCENHQEYHPIFDIDYMFFGENLTVDTETSTHLPEAYNPANRVYRVGGFYGSASDKGYFMNREAFLDTDLMTAVDFVGYRDRDIYDAIPATGLSYGADGAHGPLNERVENYITGQTDPNADFAGTGWIIEPGRHEVFMPPTLDLPWVWEENADGSLKEGTLKHDFEKFDVNSDKVTHNLLIYTENIPEALAVMQKFQYQSDITTPEKVQTLAQHSEDVIRAHHIVDYGPEEVVDGSGAVTGYNVTLPRVFGDYFHLVDKHDFDAPVAFQAHEAWYVRQPAEYAAPYVMTKASGIEKTYTTAWEGLCLPFDVRKVYAASTDADNMRDMGEITHFYGDDWKGHEYWLRRFEGVETDTDGSEDLLFGRPTADNLGSYTDKAGVDHDYHELMGNYSYTNTAIYDLYSDLRYDSSNVESYIDANGDEQPYTHDRLYHFADGESSRLIKDYRYLSRNIPYVITFPGKSYYEFDLSGEFYASKINDTGDPNKNVQPVKQTVCYLANGGALADYITIPVTDDVPMAAYTHHSDATGAVDYTMHGTFMHVTDDRALSESVLYQGIGTTEGSRQKLAVLDGYKAVDASQTERHEGTAYKVHADKMVVLPFRTYVTYDEPASGVTPAPLLVGSRSQAVPEIFEEVVPEVEPGAQPQERDIKVWVEGNKLVIDTPYDLTTNIYNVAGQTVRRIKAYKGENRFSGLPAGFYIVLGTKVLIGH